MSFAGTVWARLNAINVNEHTEKKGGLTYLSWAWAWAVLMKEYPDSFFTFLEPVSYPDGTMEVRVSVTVSNGEESVTRECWLPVMDNRMSAISHPDARKVSDAKMRCLVKCLGLHGLGLYLYAGSDLPQAEIESAKERLERLGKIADYIREGIAKNDEGQVVEAWHPLPKEDKEFMWTAISKGGTFTQDEKRYIHAAMDTLRPREAA